jgi:hypothetical protein
MDKNKNTEKLKIFLVFLDLLIKTKLIICLYNNIITLLQPNVRLY